MVLCGHTYLLRTPPRREAFKHSGGESRLWTSATVTLYLEVEDSRDSLPGTEQKMSVGTDMPPAPNPPTPASLKNGSCFAFMAKHNKHVIIYHHYYNTVINELDSNKEDQNPLNKMVVLKTVKLKKVYI